MNAEELTSRLRMLCQVLRFNIKCPRRVSLLHRDIDAANPRVVHTNVRYDVSAFVSHCDVHGRPISLAFFSAALITRRASSNFTADMSPPSLGAWRFFPSHLTRILCFTSSRFRREW